MGRKPKTGLTRVAEYRRILASLPDESVGVAVACLMLSSIHQKLRWSKALDDFERQPGFKGWGVVTERPQPGRPAVKSAVPYPRRRRPSRGEQ
jgi:hypothetical protein